MLIDTRRSKNAKASGLPALAVDWDGGFWRERFEVCADVTVPHIRANFEKADPMFHVVENFRVAAGIHAGRHEGTPYGDGDFYKWMEAAMYVAAKRGDKELEAALDEYVELIGRVQEPDGYLSTKQIIADRERAAASGGGTGGVGAQSIMGSGGDAASDGTGVVGAAPGSAECACGCTGHAAGSDGSSTITGGISQGMGDQQPGGIAAGTQGGGVDSGDGCACGCMGDPDSAAATGAGLGHEAAGGGGQGRYPGQNAPAPADGGGGSARLGDINDFEVYNFGHMFTAACVYYRLFGKRSFLDIAEKTAGYLRRLYAKYLAEGRAQTEVCPSHYMGIVELYRVTGKPEYLALAEDALAVRDLVENGSDDNQDSLPLRQHRKIVGHGVRSTYLYAGVADVFAEDGDPEYGAVLEACWRNLMEKKLYITGGCGALYYGVSPYGVLPFGDYKIYTVHQAFGYEYQLPNITAYNETCAALGSVMWNLRMFAANPQAMYFDIIERTMLNVAAASLSLGGDRYFYENMLRRVTDLDFELVWPITRSEELICFCCPPNIARFMAESSEYAYMVGPDILYTGMYGASHARVELENGAAFTIRQETDYPWDGDIRFTFDEVERDLPFTLKLRIPLWLESGYVYVNGGLFTPLDHSMACCYLDVPLNRIAGAVVELLLDMPPRLTAAHSKVEEALNQVAVERGPLVYCVESVDAPGVDDLTHLLLPADARFRETSMEIAGCRIVALETEAMVRRGIHKTALYQTVSAGEYEAVPFRMIPYFAWDNRGMGEMNIWMPVFWGKP